MGKKVQTYEKDMQRLREIVDALSKGGVALDEMMKLYEEGASLTAKCRETLDEYEAKLELIDRKNTASKGDKDE